MALEITDQNIGNILNDNKYVVIDFWAAWCGPCRIIGPIIEELADSNSDIIIGKLDVSSNTDSARDYIVTSIPTIIFFKDGQEVDRIKGVVPRQVLQDKIDNMKQ